MGLGKWVWLTGCGCGCGEVCLGEEVGMGLGKCMQVWDSGCGEVGLGRWMRVGGGGCGCECCEVGVAIVWVW